jgi:protein EFR3
MADVSNASLRALFSLLGHANSAQIGYIMHSSFDGLNQLQGWTSLDHCCWFARKAAEWSQYQYRYAVPTWLVERLHVSQETTTATPLDAALLAMVTTIFNSSTPLINLSTSDIMSNLVTLILRRTTLDPNDPLIPSLVECISSLGGHLYYSDQIQDLAVSAITLNIYLN